jgi:hypothetical protein
MTSNLDLPRRLRATRCETVTKTPAPLRLTVDDGRRQGPVFEDGVIPSADAASTAESVAIESYSLPGR